MSYDPNQQHQQQQGYGGQQQPQYGQQQRYPPPPGAPPQQGGYQQQPGGYQPPQQGYGQQQQPYNQQQYGEAGSTGQPGQAFQQAAPPEVTDTGSFQGTSWTIKHRNTNSVLEVQLHQGETVRSKTGAMIHMSPTVTLQGNVKISMRKLFTGGSMAESSYTGPGTVALAPTLFGDIVTLQVSPQKVWNVGKDAFLACTSGVTKETKSQGLGKAFFSGEDLFIYKMAGNGVAWLTSYGAIEAKSLGQGEQHIVDNGHLVAWNCNYMIEKAGGGSGASIKSGEGLVCRFTGPGMVYIQTRNLEDFKDFVRSTAGGNSS